MKRLIIILLTLLLLIPLGVSAQSISNPTSGSIFNRGDLIIITGTILTPDPEPSAQIEFSIESKSTGVSFPITTKIYSIKSGIPVSFAQITQDTLQWKVSREAAPASDYKVKVAIKSFEGGSILNFESDEFSITDKLLLEYTISQTTLNLGEKLEISGSVLDARGIAINGIADITLSEETIGTIFTDSSSIVDGFLSYSYILKQGDPSGIYTLKVEVSDQRGNTAEKDQVGIAVSGSFLTNCTVLNKDLKAGEIAILTGNIMDLHKDPVNNLFLEAYITDPQGVQSIKYSSTTDLNGNFAFDFPTKQITLPGEYKIYVAGQDTPGNKITCEGSFIISSAKNLESKLSLTGKEWYYPNEELTFTMSFENSGNEDLKGDIEVLVDSSKVLSKDIELKVGESVEYNEIWTVQGDVGNHSMRITAKVDGQILEETKPQSFEIFLRPPEPKESSSSFLWKVLLILLITLIIGVLIVKRKDIIEYVKSKTPKRSSKKKTPTAKDYSFR